jgi:hypothetical protein
MPTVIALLCLSACVAFIGPLVEGRDRSAERTVRAYVDAIQACDVDGALDLLESSNRAEWRIFVEHQSGDRIGLLSLAVQRESLLSDAWHWGAARSVTLSAELQGKGGERWQATSHIEGRVEGDRWLMSGPPFGPDEPWLVPPESP